jgi:hypothetical protein
MKTTPQTMIAASNEGNDSSDDGRVTNGIMETMNNGTAGLHLWAAARVGASQPDSVDIVLSFVQNARRKGYYFSFFPRDYFPALLLLKL